MVTPLLESEKGALRAKGEDMRTSRSDRKSASTVSALMQLLEGPTPRPRPSGYNVVISEGEEPSIEDLHRWASVARESAQWRIHIYRNEESVDIPLFAVIDPGLAEARIFQNCFIWQHAKEEKALLIPDGFGYGAFHIDDTGSMAILDRSPVKGFDAAEAGIIMAVRRLLELDKLHLIQSHLAHRDLKITREHYIDGMPKWPRIQ
ncbi:hypothetical protein [Sphingobium yanoikuyae]|nr:hypothetical protein [Sphingobium yanoikuyae]